MPNFSNAFFFGTDNLVQLIKRSRVSNNFGKELVRSSNLPIRKTRATGPPD